MTNEEIRLLEKTKDFIHWEHISYEERLEICEKLQDMIDKYTPK
jgi:hypothetical protein